MSEYHKYTNGLKLVAKEIRFEYLWQDSDSYKRPTKMPAPTYIEHLMGWVQSNIDNEAVFPSRIGASRSSGCSSDTLINQ
jgi:Mob1/phocein family